MHDLISLTQNIEEQLTQNPSHTLDRFIPLMKQYQSSDWEEYITFDTTKYTRNIVVQTDLFEILVIGWNVEQTSPIHDHSRQGCLMKILKGSITETRYDQNKEYLSEHTYNQGDINYIHNNIGLHKIENLSQQTAVSIHIYSPGRYQANIFDSQ